MKNKTIKNYIMQSLHIFKDNISFILLIVVLIFLPFALAKVLIVNQIVDMDLFSEYVLNADKYINATDTDSLAIISQITKQLSIYMVFTLALSLFTLIADIIIVKHIYNIQEGIEEDFFETFEGSIKIYPRVLWTLIIQTIFIAFGFFLILPGIYFYFLYKFALYVSIIYKIKGTRATAYSSVIVKSNFGKVIGYSLLVLLYNFIISYLFSFTMSFIKEKTANIIGEIIGQSLLLGLTTIGTILFTLLFLDMQKNLNDNIKSFLNLNLTDKTYEGQE